MENMSKVVHGTEALWEIVTAAELADKAVEVDFVADTDQEVLATAYIDHVTYENDLASDEADEWFRESERLAEVHDEARVRY